MPEKTNFFASAMIPEIASQKCCLRHQISFLRYILLGVITPYNLNLKYYVKIYVDIKLQRYMEIQKKWQMITDY